MKKTLTLVMALALSLCALAQSNAALGKKYYDSERYDKALPYLIKAVEAGDADSKARLATMIFTMQVPQYSMDRSRAMSMLDEAIEAGSVLAMERKGFCTLSMGGDTKEEKLRGIALLKQASEAGSADASFNLFKVYRDGITTYSDNEVCVAPDEEQSMKYVRLAREQGGLEGKAYVGLFMLEGSHGFDKNEAAGAALIEEAMKMDNRIFAGNCLEPGKAIVKYLKARGKGATVTQVDALLRKYHPTEY